MCAILILFIISFQFAIAYFGVKGLTVLNNKIVELNVKVEKLIPQIKPKFEKIRTTLQNTNKAIEAFFKHQNKIKVYRNLVLLKSIAVAIILYKKRKSLLNFFSMYDIVSKFAKSILEF